MANSKNLRKLTTEEAREIGRKGGVKSGEIRKKRKMMKEQISLLLSLPFPDVRDKTGKKIRTIFQQLGIDDENIDNQMAIIIAMWQQALKGNYKAFNTLRDTIGEKPTDKLEFTQDKPFEVKIEVIK